MRIDSRVRQLEWRLVPTSQRIVITEADEAHAERLMNRWQAAPERYADCLSAIAQVQAQLT